jgi:hypothetical protein
MTNAGTLNQTGTATGNVINTGALTLSSATVNGTLANNGTGTVITAGGTSSVNGVITNASTAVDGFTVATGTTLAATGFVNSGTLAGGGALNLGAGTLTNNGIIAPGGSGSVGTFTITGNLVMGTTGSVNMDVVNPTAGSFDVLTVSGFATLTGGTLNISGTTAGTYINLLNAGGGFGSTKFAAINSAFPAQTSTYTANALTVDLQYSITDNQLSELVKEVLVSPRENDGKRRGPQIASNGSTRGAAATGAPATVCR